MFSSWFLLERKLGVGARQWFGCLRHDGVAEACFILRRQTRTHLFSVQFLFVPYAFSQRDFSKWFFVWCSLILSHVQFTLLAYQRFGRSDLDLQPPPWVPPSSMASLAPRQNSDQMWDLEHWRATMDRSIRWFSEDMVAYGVFSRLGFHHLAPEGMMPHFDSLISVCLYSEN